MPFEAHLNVVRDAAGMRLDTRLMRMEDDSDPPRTFASLRAGRPAIRKVPQVATNEAPYRIHWPTGSRCHGHACCRGSVRVEG